MSDKLLENLKTVISESGSGSLKEFLRHFSPTETALIISLLSSQGQSKLLTILDPADAANIIDEVSGTQAIGLIEDLPVENSAAI